MAHFIELNILHNYTWHAPLPSQDLMWFSLQTQITGAQAILLFTVIAPLTFSTIKQLTEIWVWGMEKMLFIYGLTCPNINYFSPIYFRLMVFSNIPALGQAEAPQMTLYTKVTFCPAKDKYKTTVFINEKLISLQNKDTGSAHGQ